MSAQLYPAQALLPGHPDKLCDAIADVLVQEAIRREPHAHCRIEVAAHRATVFVTGRLAYRDTEIIDGATMVRDIDLAEVVKHVYASAGYGDEWGPSPDKLRVAVDLRTGALTEREWNHRQAAGQHALLTGYALDRPGTNYLPPEQWLVQLLQQRLARLREQAPELRLGPDGRIVVLLEEDEQPTRLAGFSATLQQSRAGSPAALDRAVRKVLTDELSHLARRSPGFDPQLPDAFAVNSGGAGDAGGPACDSGISGQALGMDTYGPRAPFTGGSLCGQDFYTADRAGALIARRLAKAVVMTGAARECLATLALVPGQVEAQILSLRGDNQRLDASRWGGLLDRSLAGVGQRFPGQASLLDVARFGHFREAQLPWEQLHFDCK